jgi:hypothetical protein
MQRGDDLGGRFDFVERDRRRAIWPRRGAFRVA